MGFKRWIANAAEALILGLLVAAVGKLAEVTDPAVWTCMGVTACAKYAKDISTNPAPDAGRKEE